MKQIEFKVAGMTCGACVARVTRTLGSISGVHDVEVDRVRGAAHVQVDDVATLQPLLLQALAAAGYPSEVVIGNADNLENIQGTTAGGCGTAPGANRGCCCRQ